MREGWWEMRDDSLQNLRQGWKFWWTWGWLESLAEGEADALIDLLDAEKGEEWRKALSEEDLMDQMHRSIYLCMLNI